MGDIRDESAEEVRLVIEPKSRTVDPVLMMESLFRLTELEIRFGLNMNVLSHGQIPNVLSLRDVLRQWLDHRKEVLIRRSQFRLRKIEHRLEVLDGYLIAYLNIDEVIRIIRFEDEPKAKLIARFGLTEVQAEAILNLRLRALSKLEEIEIKAEHNRLSKEKRDLQQLLKSEDLQWSRIADEVRETRERYSKKTDLGHRRTSFAEPPEIEVDLEQAMVEKEPITVILSEKGWIRAMKGHLDDVSKLDFKQGDRLKRAVKAFTTDKLLVFATNGRFFTLSGNELPGGRGHGEPIRLMIDLEESHDVLELFVHQPGRKLLVAATSGHGFIVPEDEVVASTRKGRQVLNVSEPDEAKVCVPADGDMSRPWAKPQDARVPARRGQRDDPRQGRDPSTDQGWQARRRPSFQQGSWAHLARCRRAHLYTQHERAWRLDWPARPSRQSCTQRLSAVEQVRTSL